MSTSNKRLAYLLREAQSANVWSTEKFAAALAEIKEATEHQLAQAFMQVFLDKIDDTQRVKTLERDCLSAVLDREVNGGSLH